MPGKEHSSSVIGWVLAYASVYALSKPVSRMLHASTSRRPDWKKKVLEGLVHTAHRLVQETAYLGSLIVHSTLAGQITLVSHKQLVYILVCVSVDLVQPCLHVVEALHTFTSMGNAEGFQKGTRNPRCRALPMATTGC
eukprot:1159024-Pelagomonas_calceolata.AAC.4